MHRSTVTPAELLELIELERREQASWPRLSIPAWHPRNEDADDEDKDGDKDGDRDKSGNRNRDRTDRDADKDGDKGKRDRGSKDDDEDDDDADERTAAGFARLRRENRELKAQAEERDRKAREESGKYEDLYNDERNKSSQLEGRVAELELDIEVLMTAAAEGARNPKRVMRLMRADGLLDDADKDDVERLVKRFKRSDSDLFGSAATRQTRRRARDEDEDDETDERDERDEDKSTKSKTDKQPVSRLRRGIEATNPRAPGGARR